MKIASKKNLKAPMASNPVRVIFNRDDLAKLYAWARGSQIMNADALREWIRDFKWSSSAPFEGPVAAWVTQAAIGVCQNEIEDGADLGAVTSARDLIRRLRGIPG